MMKIVAGTAAVLGALVVAEAGSSLYLYRRTMKRQKAKVERTIKMAGTDWNQYHDFIQERKAAMLEMPHNDVYLKSEDGLTLHGVFFPGNGEVKKAVICFHGYTSEAMKDYIGLSDYYHRNGYAMLMVDERAHGSSEGDYIGFGCLDRKDALLWIKWIIKECGEDVQLLLHGNSMGGATVLMTSSLDLPKQVKGIISDCGFTSPKEVFTHVLRTMYHMPAFPMMQIVDKINQKLAGYGLDECNAAREVRNAKVPILLIHGSADTFVPCEMCERIYENCASPKKKLIVEGAAHAESYYKATAAYEAAMDDFIGGIIK